MNATANSFSAITSQEKVLRIPFFQRKYVWGKVQWEKLWEDLTDSFENEDSHFLGSVILKQIGSSMGSERLVIDGQQRLTTYSIFLKTIMDIVGKENLPDLLVPSILTKQGGDRFPKIEHSKHDRKSYQCVMQEGFIPLPDTNDKIVSCYYFFREKILEMPQDKLLEFTEKILNDKIWVHITIDEQEDEQRIFDSINTSGIVLSEMDIVKNFLFKFQGEKGMEKASKLYDEAWKPVFDEDEEDIKFWDTKVSLGRVERSQSDVLLQNVAVIEGIYNPNRGQKIDKIGTLYKQSVKDQNDSNESRQDIIKKILDYAKIFRNLPFMTNTSEYSHKTTPIERFLQIVEAFDMSTATPVALYLEYKRTRKEISAQEYENCLKLIEQYIIRRAIKNLPTKPYNKTFYDLLEAIKDKPKMDSVLVQYLESRSGETEIFPTKVEIAGLSFDNMMPRLARILLFWVELQRQVKKNATSETLKLNYLQYQLEHLMPQSWIEYWPLPEGTSEEDRERHIHMIGNFTLLKPKLNKIISNNTWTIKVNGDSGKPGIKGSSRLSISEEVTSKKIWNETEIKNRTEKLKQEIIDIWCD